MISVLIGAFTMKKRKLDLGSVVHIHPLITASADTSRRRELATARTNASPHVRQKSPLSLWYVPPDSVSSCSAGFPHHWQTLPSGAASIERGWRNSFSMFNI